MKDEYVYLDNYANEIAYREDTRKQDNLTTFNDVTSKCLSTSSDNAWKGYWQGNHRQRTTGNVMAKKIYLSQIQAKIDRLQRERKQVLEHLTLVEDKLNKTKL